MQTALVIILLLAILAGAVFRWPLWMGISRRRHYAGVGLDDDGSRYLLYPSSWRRSYGLAVLQQPCRLR